MTAIEINIPALVVPVAYWGYAQAFCTDRIALIGSERGDEESQKYHEQLAKLFGVNVDNKQTFKVKAIEPGDFESMLYITCHDGNVYIGTGVRGYNGNLPAPTKTY